MNEFYVMYYSHDESDFHKFGFTHTLEGAKLLVAKDFQLGQETGRCNTAAFLVCDTVDGGPKTMGIDEGYEKLTFVDTSEILDILDNLQKGK